VRAVLLGLCALVCGLLGRRAAAEDRVLAVFLPGVHFGSLEQRLELGNELATHLFNKLGERYRLTPRVYSSADAMEADAGRIALALVEAPYVAARLTALLPLSVATAGPSAAETRLVIMAAPSVRLPTELRRVGLAFASPLEAPQALLDNLIFEGELGIPREVWQPTRDVASALSLASLHKAEAVLMYEDDLAAARQASLRPLYTSDRLPRPTLVMMDRRADAAEAQRVREALAQFKGQVQPTLRAFRATSDEPYQALRARMEKRPRRTPLLVELHDEQAGSLPRPRATSTSLVPLRAYAPE
jgi:hypothetical protein